MLAVHQDVCATGLGSGLKRVARNCKFADDAFGRFQYDLARCAFGSAIVFDVVAGDLNVVNITLKLADARTFAVADMITNDDDLMQVAFVKKHAGVAVVIYMTLGEQKVSIALRKMNPIPAIADEHLPDGCFPLVVSACLRSGLCGG